MISWLLELWEIFVDTVFDVLPIAGILFGFQVLVLRRRIPHNPD